ncbi:MAG TPA: hypothetical protein VN175_08085, partial [Rhizomicrobium sp.]|nr:hypothetical protein [Rhizomicrobium sp.]
MSQFLVAGDRFPLVLQKLASPGFDRATLPKNNFQISRLWKNVAQNGGSGRQQHIRPDERGQSIGNHE